MSDEISREAFEKWVTADSLQGRALKDDFRRDGERYADRDMDLMWYAWQAARKTAEDAMKEILDLPDGCQPEIQEIAARFIEEAKPRL